MVEAAVCFALIAGLSALWIFAWLARAYFRRRRRAGMADDSFLARVFSEPPGVKAGDVSPAREPGAAGRGR